MRPTETRIQYESPDAPGYVVESVKEQKPHASGSGYWWFTRYIVQHDGSYLGEYYKLAAAKAAVEKAIGGASA